jgi:putative acetyltransferase
MKDSKNLIDSNDFNIRYTTQSDEPYLKKWLEDPEVAKGFSFALEEERDEFLKIWMGYVRFKCSLTATYKEVPCGIATLFLMPYVKLIHQSMGYVVVDPLFRRKRVGTSLVRNLDHLAKNYFKLERLHFEIFGETPLEPLLEKLNYKKLFTQQKYVKDGSSYLPRIVLEKVFKDDE